MLKFRQIFSVVLAGVFAIGSGSIALSAHNSLNLGKGGTNSAPVSHLHHRRHHHRHHHHHHRRSSGRSKRVPRARSLEKESW